jgi:hypothetical protein
MMPDSLVLMAPHRVPTLCFKEGGRRALRNSLVAVILVHVSRLARRVGVDSAERHCDGAAAPERRTIKSTEYDPATGMG